MAVVEESSTGVRVQKMEGIMGGNIEDQEEVVVAVSAGVRKRVVEAEVKVRSRQLRIKRGLESYFFGWNAWSVFSRIDDAPLMAKLHFESF